MPATYYPAVIDKSASGFGVSFPDFPGCIANGDTPSEAAVNAEQALAFHIEGLAKDGDPIPDPSDIAEIEKVEGAEDVARILVRIERPAKVARVLVSMDENLLRAIDAIAPNRSAFLADAARSALKARQYPQAPYVVMMNGDPLVFGADSVMAAAHTAQQRATENVIGCLVNPARVLHSWKLGNGDVVYGSVGAFTPDRHFRAEAD